MPELIEIELYREHLDSLVGGRVENVSLGDDRFVRPRGEGSETFDILVGLNLHRTRRHGKLLLASFVDPKALHGGTVALLGLRFGMTGRLLIDGGSAIDQLEYSSPRNDAAWDRFEMTVGGRCVAIRDQRCLGSVELDPDLSALAPDALSVTPDELHVAFARRSKAIKAALLDQNVIAGLGNLLADEVLWTAGINPNTPVDELIPLQLTSLAAEIRRTVTRLMKAGGSNMGESFCARHDGARCPKCDGTMRRDSLAGRTAWWCPAHQV